VNDPLDRRYRRERAYEARDRRIAAASFFVTCLSVFVVRLWSQWTDDVVENTGRGFASLGFAVLLMGILLSHELGHWVVARLHGFRLSLPIFLPAPVLTGTFGAIIRLEEDPRDRTGLAEMGAAGPLAGFAIVCCAAFVWVIRGPVPGDGALSRPALLWVLSALLRQEAPASPVVGDGLGFAVWLGCLLTAMNLLPIGQLDGGHIARAMLPRASWWVARAALAGLVILGLVWPMWAIWAIVILVVGAWRSLDVPDAPTATPRSVGVAIAALVTFVLCFTPVPM
jgi:membrane-associated protease RseP (regulator of RpoE activity)